MENVSSGTLAALCGLGIGAVVGAAALVSNFCALGAVADILFAKDWRRMRAWMLLGTLLWLVNNLAVGSIGGSLLEACLALSNLRTIWRWREHPG